MVTVPHGQTIVRGAVRLHLQYPSGPEREIAATSYEARPLVGWLLQRPCEATYLSQADIG